MRLRHFSVKGFKTLDELELKDLNDFNVFVGENNTGKSNILDALHVFISNIFPLSVSSRVDHPDELWPGAIREEDIEWTAEFDFSIREFTELIQKTGLDQSRVIEVFGPGRWIPANGDFARPGLPFVKIDRILRSDNKQWETKNIQLNDLRYWISGERAPDLDRPLIDAIDSAVMNVLNRSLKRVDVVRGSIVRGHEASRSQYSGTRTALVPNETLSSLVQMFSNWTDADQKRINTMNMLFGALTSGCRVVAQGTRIVVVDGKSETSIRTVGGGIQEMLQLAYDISEGSDFLLLEEPESHLHPRLTQNLFYHLKQLSAERQLFVATHSTTFIDQASLPDIWLVTRQNGGTRCERFQQDDDLPRIALELGLLPSYACQNNSMLFVEGPSDRIVLSKWFELAGLRLRRPMVHVEELNGKNQGRRRALWWGRITRALPRMGLALLFDADLDDREMEEIRISIGSANRIWRLNEGSIEDYYDPEMLKSAVTSEVEMSKEQETEIRNLKPGQVSKQIDRILGTDVSWKVSAAERIADASHSRNDIPSKILSIIEEVMEYIRMKSVP